MTRDDIIKLAREAGKVLEDEWDVGGLSDGFYMDWAEEIAVRVAIQVAAAEREACARVCDDKALRMEREAADAGADDAISLRSSAWLISVCAAAIRARGQA